MAERPIIPINTFVGRKEDMSSSGRLLLLLAEDGDICVKIVEPSGHDAGVEFCLPGSGGGKSPRTLAALRNLMLAIMEDNEEEPRFAAHR